MVLLCPWQPELLRKETAPQVLSWSCTFSFRYECGCQLKGVWKKKSSTTRQRWHRSQLPDLHLLTSEPADVSEVSLGTDRLYKLTEEPSLSLRFCRKGKEKIWGKVCHSNGIRGSVSPFWPASVRSCLGLTCSQLLLIQKLISCRHFTAVHNKDFS